MRLVKVLRSRNAPGFFRMTGSRCCHMQNEEFGAGAKCDFSSWGRGNIAAWFPVMRKHDSGDLERSLVAIRRHKHNPPRVAGQYSFRYRAEAMWPGTGASMRAHSDQRLRQLFS